MLLYSMVMIVIFTLLMLIYFLFLLMSYKVKMDMETMSSYECGFDMKSESRFIFSYRFFLIGILFLIFDVEISLMLPVPFISENYLGVMVFYGFIVILLVGLIYEYYCGSLEWMDVLVSKA